MTESLGVDNLLNEKKKTKGKFQIINEVMSFSNHSKSFSCQTSFWQTRFVILRGFKSFDLYNMGFLEFILCQLDQYLLMPRKCLTVRVKIQVVRNDIINTQIGKAFYVRYFTWTVYWG